MAWQFDRPEQGEGMVQAFRRSDSPRGNGHLQDSGPRPQATYLVTDIDVNQPQAVAGSELLTKGLAVSLKERSSAAVITYRRLRVAMEPA